MVERQRKARTLDEKGTRIQAVCPAPPTNTIKLVAPPSRPVTATPTFMDPPGFMLVKTIGLFFAVTPANTAPLDDGMAERARLRIGTGVLEALNSLKEVSKSPAFILAVTRSNEALSFALLPDSTWSSQPIDEAVTRFYSIDDLVISVETATCISDYTWCLMRRLMGVIDRDGEWRVGHPGGAATLRILHSGTPSTE